MLDTVLWTSHTQSTATPSPITLFLVTIRIRLEISTPLMDTAIMNVARPTPSFLSSRRRATMGRERSMVIIVVTETISTMWLRSLYTSFLRSYLGK